jgi:hypothetical protein
MNINKRKNGDLQNDKNGICVCVNKEHYVIKFDSDLRHVCDFLRVLRFPSPIKLTSMK